MDGSHQFNLALAVTSGAVLAVGLFDLALQRAWLTRPMVCLAVGALVGPAALGFVDPAAWGVEPVVLVEQVSRLTLAVSLMAVAIHLPPDYLRRRWRALALLLGGGMLVMLAASAAVAGALGLAGGAAGGAVAAALLLGAIVTPTDPVLAATVVTGPVAEKNLPERLRHLVFAESAANDGLAYPFVLLGVLHVAHPAGRAWAEWLTRVLLWEVLAAVAIGAVLGYAVGRAQVSCQRRRWGVGGGLTGAALALTLLALSGVKLVGGDGVLAVFAAGVAFRHVARGAVEREEDVIQDTIQQFFVLPAFVLLGATLPWAGWASLGWGRLIGAALLLLALRRPLALLVMRVPLSRLGAVASWREAAFAGWFGPVGVAALFYAALADRRTGDDRYWIVASFVVAASVVLHGVTAYPLTVRFGRATGRADAPDPDAATDDGGPR